MSSKLKKILIVVGFIILVLVLAWLIYTLFFRTAIESVNNEPAANLPPINGLPAVNDGSFNQPVNQLDSGLPPLTGEPGDTTGSDLQREAKPVTPARVSGVALTGRDELRYYNREDGKFYRYVNGQPSELSDKIFFNVEEVTWSRNGDRAVLEYPDGYNIVYDFRRDKQISLPPELEDFSFDNSGDKIAAKAITGQADNNWVVTANYDGSGLKFIEHLGDKKDDVQINWSPAGEIIATYREGIDFERQEVYPIGQSGGNIKSLVTDGRGFEGSWSPQGDYMLYSVYNTSSSYKPTLYLADMGGDYTGSFKLNFGINTWSHKCTFGIDSRKVYCAVPEKLPQLSGIFPELVGESNDQFYEIDLSTGGRRLLGIPQGAGVNATQLNISAAGDVVYFVDQNTGQLKSMPLR
ncbi:MAG: hypothetical protein NUV82_00065 [Candidatus Komeilibacteria bacterium]|nr:hypothetical protein [Candidatus Komeilibacteria bacterium]